jgi:hypothetical protein
MLLLEVFAVPRGRVKSSAECGCIMFSTMGELLEKLFDEMSQFTSCFTQPSKEFNTMEFTVMLPLKEFGIGMHNAAMFMLLLGEKKWNMTLSGDLEGDSDMQPGLYWEKSLHKCILRQGEILFMQHEWYHKIFNLGEYTVGTQVLPE